MFNFSKHKFIPAALVAVSFLFAAEGSCGIYVKNYSTGSRVVELDGSYIKSYSTGARKLEISGRLVRDYNKGRSILEVDGNYIKDYSTGGRKYELSGGTSGSISSIQLFAILYCAEQILK